MAVGSKRTVEIGSNRDGPDTAQAGWQIPGPGLGCGLGRGARARGSYAGRFSESGPKAKRKKNTAGLAGLPRVLCTAGPLLASGLQGVRCAGRARVKRAKIGRTTQFAQFFLFFLFPETIIDAF